VQVELHNKHFASKITVTIRYFIILATRVIEILASFPFFKVYADLKNPKYLKQPLINIKYTHASIERKPSL